MKKTTIIISLILISIFSTIYISSESIKNNLPEPKIGPIKNWDVDKRNCTEKITILTANMELFNPPNNLTIDFIKRNSRFEISYGTIVIGNVSFIHPHKLKTIKADERINLEKNEKIDIPLYFEIDNVQLRNAICMHINVNDENGTISFEMNISIDIDIPFISGFLNEVEKKLSFTIPIQTDLLDAIDQLIYRTGFNTVLSNNEQRGIFKKNFNINMYKNAHSNIVYVNLTSLRMNIPCIDINLGERLEWNTLCQPYSIQASKHFIITWNWLKELLVKQFIFKDKEKFEMYANLFKLGNINVEKISERKLGLLLTGCKQTTYNIIMKFDLTDFDKILHCHIIHDEETTFTIPDLGISFTFDKKIADMLPEISPITDPLRWDDVRNFLSHLQSLAFGGILGIILLILYDCIWKKIFMKKQ